MQSCSQKIPPGALYNLIPTAGQHTVLQRNHGSYKDAVQPTRNVNAEGNPINPNRTNNVGSNNQALEFQRSFIEPATTCVNLNSTGLPIPLSSIEQAFANTDPQGYAIYVASGKLGPTVLNLGPLQ
jgi:hypothetical protein